MGQAKRRGTKEERTKKAIEEGRIKTPNQHFAVKSAINRQPWNQAVKIFNKLWNRV